MSNRHRRIVTARYASSAALDKVLAAQDRAEAIAPHQLPKADAHPRSYRKRITRAAVNALAKAGGRGIELKHIHPRWLRLRVEQLLDAGEEINEERLNELRKEGPNG